MGAVREIPFKYNDDDRFGYTLKVSASATANRTITIPDSNITLGGGANYTAAVVNLTQASTANPVATVLNATDSNYLGAITWTRLAGGIYWGTKTGAFSDADKVLFLTGSPDISGGAVIVTVADANKIQIETKGSNGSDADGILNHFSLEVRVYP